MLTKRPNPELSRRILDIALEELGTKAPDKVNMRSIAEKAGVSPTAIYYYFPSKDELFERIKFDAIDDLDLRLSAVERIEEGPRERLAALVRIYAAWCVERPHLARLLMEELPPREALTEETIRRYYSAFFRARDLVEEAIAEGSLKPRDVLLDVSMAQAAVWGIVTQFLAKRVHPQYWGSIDPLIESFIDLYLGKEGDSA